MLEGRKNRFGDVEVIAEHEIVEVLEELVFLDLRDCGAEADLAQILSNVGVVGEVGEGGEGVQCCRVFENIGIGGPDDVGSFVIETAAYAQDGPIWCGLS